MKAVILALAIALFLPFFLGFTSAFLVPPLCWWLESRKPKPKSPSLWDVLDACKRPSPPSVVPVDKCVQQEVLNAWRKSRAN